MATKKKAPRARRSAAPRARKTKRRANTLNKSVRKPMQAIGTVVGGLVIPYGPAAAAAIKQRSLTPLKGQIMNPNNAIGAAKTAAIGFLVGTAAGTVVDKVGLKKPVNRLLRTARKFTGGLI